MHFYLLRIKKPYLYYNHNYYFPIHLINFFVSWFAARDRFPSTSSTEGGSASDHEQDHENEISQLEQDDSMHQDTIEYEHDENNEHETEQEQEHEIYHDESMGKEIFF